MKIDVYTIIQTHELSGSACIVVSPIITHEISLSTDIPQYAAKPLRHLLAIYYEHSIRRIQFVFYCSESS